MVTNRILYWELLQVDVIWLRRFCWTVRSKGNHPDVPHTGFVREQRLLEFLPFSHSTLWRRVKAWTFPAPVKISGRVTAWRAEDVRAWINKYGAASVDTG
jgi:predicted DNA-binding transcriptional regulator AlpA